METETKLSDVPSELLRQIAHDFQLCIDDGRYEINMYDRRTPNNNKCEMCMAGSLMAKSLGADSTEEYNPEFFDKTVNEKLHAINEFKQGFIMYGFRQGFIMYGLSIMEEFELSAEQKIYIRELQQDMNHINLKTPKDIITLAENLEEMGL